MSWSTQIGQSLNNYYMSCFSSIQLCTCTHCYLKTTILISPMQIQLHQTYFLKRKKKISIHSRYYYYLKKIYCLISMLLQHFVTPYITQASPQPWINFFSFILSLISTCIFDFESIKRTPVACSHDYFYLYNFFYLSYFVFSLRSSSSECRVWPENNNK